MKLAIYGIGLKLIIIDIHHWFKSLYLNNNSHNQYLLSHSKINKQAHVLKQRILTHSERYDEQFRIGIEIEICLLDSEAKTVSAQPLIEELKGKEYQVDNEYGSCQFEFRTPPTNMENILELNILFEQFIDYIDKVVQNVYKNRDVYPVFLGANPSPQILQEELITDKPRYKKLAEWQSKIPDVEIDGQKIRALQIATAIQGFHLHLQGQNPAHTALMFNHILNIIPSAILLGANSKERQLRPLAVLREERTAVIRSGYDAMSHFNIMDTIRSQLDFAKKGLSDLGLKGEFLNILEKRLENKNSPGSYVAKLWHEKFNGSVEKTVFEIISHMWERTKINQPII